MKKLRPLRTLILASLLIFLWMLPGASQLDLSDELASLPDADLREMAEEFWSKGEEDTALLMLDYIVDQNMGDKEAATQLRDTYLKELQDGKAPLGRLKSAGWGLATGEVKNWESLAGSSVGDLFLYGDLRDLTRELVFEKDTDEFVLAMSALGLATTLFPPADPAVSMLKASKKVGALSEPMVNQVKKVAKAVGEASSEGAKIEKLKDGLLPFYELSRHTRTWSEYTTLLRHADSIDQIKFLTKMAAHQPGNGKKLAQILSTAGRGGVDAGKRSLEFIMTNGQKGMDALYVGLRKGPKGLKFVAEHPTLVTRGLKNVKKTTNWFSHEVADAALKWGAWFQVARLAAIGIVSALLFLSIVPKKWVEKAFGGAFAPSSNPSKRAAVPPQFILAAGVGLITALLVFVYGMVAAPAQPQMPGDSYGIGGATGTMGARRNMAMSFVMVLITLTIQGGIWLNVRRRLGTVDEMVELPSLKLKRIENMDIFFDLPLYAGLALTIGAFILITVDAGMSRILAYSSTIIGILSTVSLRVNFLHPLRERLLDATKKDAA